MGNSDGTTRLDQIEFNRIGLYPPETGEFTFTAAARHQLSAETDPEYRYLPDAYLMIEEVKEIEIMELFNAMIKGTDSRENQFVGGLDDCMLAGDLCRDSEPLEHIGKRTQITQAIIDNNNQRIASHLSYAG